MTHRNSSAAAAPVRASSLPDQQQLAAVPLYVSQKSSLATFGLSPREFREFVRAERLPVVERGKTRLVEARLLAERLASKATQTLDALPESNTERLRRVAGLSRAGRAT
jgi:hypothetical protein